MIFIDDMGYGDIGPFGSTANGTPHLDRMAAEGMKLTSFYSAAPVCTPSRAALMTGSYPKRVGLATGPEMGVLYPGDEWGLNPAEVTVAELLQAQGYATGCFGKWHLGDQPQFLPTEHGFDTYFGIPYSNDMWPFHSRTPEGSPYDFPPLPLMRGTDVVEVVEDMRAQAVLAERFTDEAVSFIRANYDRPFFVYLPHAFIHHPRASFGGSGSDPDAYDWTAITAGARAWQCDAARVCGPGSASEEEWNALILDRTRSQIEDVDASVGTILDTLRELDLDEDTLVVFTSDNGGARGSVNAPLRGGKGSTWEGGMREPTLAWWPGTVPGGSSTDEVATTMDLLPTFAALSGGAAPADRELDGRDISDLLTGRPGARSPHEAIFYYRQAELQAVRSGRWKLFRTTGALYDLETDIGETRDLAADQPEIVERLTELLDQAARTLGASSDSCPECRPVGVAENAQTLLPRPD